MDWWFIFGIMANCCLSVALLAMKLDNISIATLLGVKSSDHSSDAEGESNLLVSFY
jgi:hypothetical protein